MHQFVADGPAWLTERRTGVKQPAVTPLDASYPQEADKPGWLGAAPGGPFWWYADRLILFDGDVAKLAQELGTPPPSPSDDDTNVPPATLVELQRRLTEAETRLESLIQQVEKLDDKLTNAGKVLTEEVA